MDPETDTTADDGSAAPDTSAPTDVAPVVDQTAMIGAANAKIAELSAQLDAALAELQATKAANWDLSQLVGTGEPVDGDSDAGVMDGDDPASDDLGPEGLSIDDLFGAAN